MFLRFPPSAMGPVMSGFSLKGPQFQFADPDLFFSGVIHGSLAYLSISIRWVMGEYPGERELKRIPERFPPLRLRVCDWTTSRLILEAGRYPPFDYDPLRNSIIIRELMKRSDFNPDQLEPVLRKVRCLDKRAVIDGAAQAQRSEEFATAIEVYFAKRRDRDLCPM